MWLAHCLSALLQLHLHGWLNTWLECIGQRQLEDETGNIQVLEFDAAYIRCLTGTGYWQVRVTSFASLQCCHDGRDAVSNHQPDNCLLKRLFRHISKKTSKLRVTGLCEGNSPLTGEFPAQMASNAEFFSIWWRHNDVIKPRWSTTDDNTITTNTYISGDNDLVKGFYISKAQCKAEFIPVR